MRKLRLLPDHTNFAFMRGRIAGLAVSATLSIISVILFFHPGLHYGIDFKGGLIIEARLAQQADFPALRHLMGGLDVGAVTLQQFGTPNDVLIWLRLPAGGPDRKSVVLGTRVSVRVDRGGRRHTKKQNK